MTLRDHITAIRGLRYVADELELLSPVGRRVMLESPLGITPNSINEELDAVAAIKQTIEDDQQLRIITDIGLRLMQVRDVAGTIVALHSGTSLTDIDLYELKCLTLTTEAIQASLAQLSVEIPLPTLPNLTEVLRILDPENKRVPQFYVYDIYSIELAELRRQVGRTSETDKQEELHIQIAETEDRIRRHLSKSLRPTAPALSEALTILGRIDYIVAKAKLAQRMRLSRPTITDSGHSLWSGLYHPEVAASLRERNRKFQPIDIETPAGTTLITGANMAGKTVLLRALAVAQLMAQYGFFVPAQQARVVPVEYVILSIGDDQDEREGLSSYGAEMMRLSEICSLSEQEVPLLALIDEPARTTNPIEGTAIVAGLIDLLSTKSRTSSVITTHYGNVAANCRRLRVKGFVEERVQSPLSINQLNECIDYSLEAAPDKDVPQEALRIAEILGVYPRLIQLSSKYIHPQNENK